MTVNFILCSNQGSLEKSRWLVTLVGGCMHVCMCVHARACVCVCVNLFIEWIKCENIFMDTEARLLPNAPIQNWMPDSRLLPNAYSTTCHHRCHHSLICISCYQSYHCQTFISIVSAVHKLHPCAVKHDGHWLLYQEYIDYICQKTQSTLKVSCITLVFRDS
jgi:hypothetical protein